MEPSLPAKKYGTYRIEKQVGSDAYGMLYRAYDEVLDRPAALKVLSIGLSQHADLVEHFRDKIKDLARVTNPHIPQIYCFGKQNEEYFVALEWCPGGSLSNELRTNGRLQLERALAILRQCVEGLATAWKIGIAHGNLKPNNVMINEEGEIKIADFGLVSERSTGAGVDVSSVSGALSFMAPELADRGAIDFRADIYSLGIMLHYMLLNRLPLHQLASRSIKADSQSALIPPAIWELLDKMTRENPQERFGSYDELLQQIDRLAIVFPQQRPPTVPKASHPGEPTLRNSESLFDLLAQLYSQMVSGILRVNWLSVKKEFLVRDGEIIFFESNQPNESLFSLLKEKRWLRDTDYPQGPPEAEKLIERVLQDRTCTEDQLRLSYLKLMKAALFSMLQWPVLEAEFVPAEIMNDSFVFLRISDVLLEASRTFIDLGRIRSLIPVDSLINRTASFERLLAPFPLSPEESFLAYRFEGDDISPETLGMLTGLPEEKLYRILYLLQRIGALEFRSAVHRKPRRVQRFAPVAIPQPQTVAPVAPVPPAPMPAPAVAVPVAPAPAAAVRPAAPAPITVVNEPPRPTVPLEPAPVPGRSSIPGVDPEWKIRKAEALYQKAEEACDLGNYGMAAHICKEALSYHEWAACYNLLGAAYAHHPRFQRDAEEAFHKAILLDPSSADHHATLSLFYSQRNLWLRARTHCLKALDISAKHEIASKVFEAVLEKKPGTGDCWCVRVEGKPAR